MADVDFHGAGLGGIGDTVARVTDALGAVPWANWAGALSTLALAGGLTVWGVDLALRDVRAVPVIRAMEGPMRMAPEEPGGARAPHQGLALSEITAGGAASPAADTIRLAPPPAAMDAPSMAARAEPADDAPPPVTSLGDKLALLSAGASDGVEVVTPASAALGPARLAEGFDDGVGLDLADGGAAADFTDGDAAVEIADGDAPEGPVEGASSSMAALIAATVAEVVQPGLVRSARPPRRPDVLEARSGRAASRPVAAPAVDAATLKVGTRLVQLGAFDSEAVAREAWRGIEKRHRDYLAGKGMVVQKATSGTGRSGACARRASPTATRRGGSARRSWRRDSPASRSRSADGGVPGAFTFGCAGPTLGRDEAAFLRDADPWGFILFARNVSTPDGVRALTASLREAVGRDAPVLVDQEGGRVARLPPPAWTGWPPPLDHMARARDPERLMRLRAAVIGAELRAVGIDVNCTPCTDVAQDDTHPILRNRCYGGDAATVSRLARANADGCRDGGVLPVMKHVPGHGRATADSHEALPRVAAPLDVLWATDFAPVAALADLPMAMTAHVVYEALDDRPGTVSPPVIGLIRSEIGFDGLLMTDDVSMGALPGTTAGRCAAALAAGCDLVLHCNGERRDMEAVAAACPALAGRAAERAAAALARRPAVPGIDPDEARAALAALATGG